MLSCETTWLTSSSISGRAGLLPPAASSGRVLGELADALLPSALAGAGEASADAAGAVAAGAGGGTEGVAGVPGRGVDEPPEEANAGSLAKSMLCGWCAMWMSPWATAARVAERGPQSDEFAVATIYSSSRGQCYTKNASLYVFCRPARGADPPPHAAHPSS